MDKAILLDQLDWVQARIEEVERQVINYDPDGKGYKELVEGYNKLVDRYDKLLDSVEHFDDENLEDKQLRIQKEIEDNKIALEREKLQTQEEIEQDKINLETEKLRLDREKFAYDTQNAPRKEIEDVIFKTVDIATRLAVPVIGFMGIRYVANLSYMNDAELKLCNGRIAGGVKDMLKVLTMKV